MKVKADKYLNQAWELHEHEDIEMMKKFLQRKMEEEGCDALDLAAAMLKMQVGDKSEEIAVDDYAPRRGGRSDGRGGRTDGRSGRGDRSGRTDGRTGRFGDRSGGRGTERGGRFGDRSGSRSTERDPRFGEKRGGRKSGERDGRSDENGRFSDKRSGRTDSKKRPRRDRSDIGDNMPRRKNA